MTQDSTFFPEITRLQYLQQLGITSYYPRFVLDGAAPSPACAWPQLEPAVQEAVRRDAAPPPAPRVSVSAVDLAPPAHDRQDSTPAAQLHLVLLRAGEALALCCQLPLLTRSGLATRQQQLLDNILRWLDPGAVSGEQRVFKWPLPGLEHTVTDAGMAGLSLGHFFEQAACEQAFSELVVFGQQVADCLHSAPRRDTVAPWQVTTTHSLDELLSQPLLKRDTWQTLLPLRLRLSQR